jgi:single-stranded DNA-binding protein
MKYGFNKVQLIGVIESLSQMLPLPNGKNIVNGIITTPHMGYDKAGEKVKYQERHNLTFYDNTGYLARDLLTPNTIAFVEGYLNYKIRNQTACTPSSVFAFIIVKNFLALGKDTFSTPPEIDESFNYNNWEKLP